ncbi:hypothetical protein KCP69_10260 [Salmonella enterica subsp. enterica]|nr:hypothetical protein KCP69_10260 [Salmonella enterica subsp. enterica]
MNANKCNAQSAPTSYHLKANNPSIRVSRLRLYAASLGVQLESGSVLCSRNQRIIYTALGLASWIKHLNTTPGLYFRKRR